MFHLPGGDSRSTNLAQIKEYTFEVFMCAAILMECRQDLAKCSDSSMVFTFINKSVIVLLLYYSPFYSDKKNNLVFSPKLISVPSFC